MTIKIRGAKENNLKNVNVDLKQGFTVVTGVSGSGKSSLVFDTLYQETIRRQADIFAPPSFNAVLTKSKVDSISGIRPILAVGQNLLNRNPGSTVVSASGLHPLLRLLYARLGVRYCSKCDCRLSLLTEDEIVIQLLDRIKKLKSGNYLHLYIPLLQNVKGSHQSLLVFVKQKLSNYAVLIDNQNYADVSDIPQILNPDQNHCISICILSINNNDRSIKNDFQESKGNITVKDLKYVLKTASNMGIFSIFAMESAANETENLSKPDYYTWAPICYQCGTWYHPLEPKYFHFDCPHCSGKGCTLCQGTGLYPESIKVQFYGKSFPVIQELTIQEFDEFFALRDLPVFAKRLQHEITKRSRTLLQVGLGYVTLGRPVPSLSRGEAQRLRLALILLCGLEDMLYILDEPTIGQHPFDVNKLLKVFYQLKGPVVYVEHDRNVVKIANEVIDIGPGAGEHGGEVIFTGSPQRLWQADTPSGWYFSFRKKVLGFASNSEPENFIKIEGAHARNLRNINVRIPCQQLSVITGVSGSGKSTLLEEVIIPSINAKKPICCRSISGNLPDVVYVDQSPIGKNPRSNPATYTKLSDMLRDFYARKTKLSASYFSFNRPEGACKECQGLGSIEIRMRYLAPIYITCHSCQGLRYSPQIREKQIFWGKEYYSIADLYKMSISHVADIVLDNKEFKELYPGAKSILNALTSIGLGYLKLGQSSPTLSGGEAQRIKLSKYLGLLNLKQKLLILDEPSTGMHPQDVSGLLLIFNRLITAGATILVVEHNTDIIRAAQWCIDLGPGAGPKGGQILFQGLCSDLIKNQESLTARALNHESKLISEKLHESANTNISSQDIIIENAYANNLKNISLKIPKGKITVVTGVSGSGKSSIVKDVLEKEARRRFLESLSLYERQAFKEGTEAEASSVKGLGVTFSLIPHKMPFSRRNDIGDITEINLYLRILFAQLGRPFCPECKQEMQEKKDWTCPICHKSFGRLKPEDFDPAFYLSACKKCHGVGTIQELAIDRIIVRPEKPLCAGALHSTGFFPQSYFSKPYNGGYYYVLALSRRYLFDPFGTPWKDMTHEAQNAFLYGDKQPLEVHSENKKGQKSSSLSIFRGFFFLVGDWDYSNTFTDNRICPVCHGSGLNEYYSNVVMANSTIHEFRQMELSLLANKVACLPKKAREPELVQTSKEIIKQRICFLQKVGLGYISADRLCSTLSVGETQRIKLARLLGSHLTYLTVLLDEPTRGLHPQEVEAFIETLLELKNQGNTIVIVEHDTSVINRADYIIEMGPGAGTEGGQVINCYESKQEDKKLEPDINLNTACKINIPDKAESYRQTELFNKSLKISGACENNLKNIDVEIPLQRMVGVCGASGSGKSTLIIDILARALVSQKYTTSLAPSSREPGKHSGITGAPAKTYYADQTALGVINPHVFLGLDKIFNKIYMDEYNVTKKSGYINKCTLCNGRGFKRIDMGYLPAVRLECHICHGSGYGLETQDLVIRELSLHELVGLTCRHVSQIWYDNRKLNHIFQILEQIGLSYLVLKQPAYSLSGGELQRLKLVKELIKKNNKDTLYIFDEPTVGLHQKDIDRLLILFRGLVEKGNSVLIIEHHPYLLAACDWLIELGPGGGQNGGKLLAQGTPSDICKLRTPIAPYLVSFFQ